MSNICLFTGRLTRDPDLNEYGGTPKAEFSIAVSERRRDKQSGEMKEKTSFLDCFAWASGAEAIAKYFKKGSLITVHCKAEQERWEKDGKNYSRVTFRVKEFEFPPFNSPPDKGKGNGGGGNSAPAQENTTPEGGGDDGEEIPF